MYKEVPPLIRQERFKELAVFTVFMVFAASLALMQIFDIKIPNPTKGIENVVNKLVNIRFEYRKI